MFRKTYSISADGIICQTMENLLLFLFYFSTFCYLIINQSKEYCTNSNNLFHFGVSIYSRKSFVFRVFQADPLHLLARSFWYFCFIRKIILFRVFQRLRFLASASDWVIYLLYSRKFILFRVFKASFWDRLYLPT
jgi:hypothetical protein